MPEQRAANSEPMMDDLVFPGWELLVGGALLATTGWRHPFVRGLAVGAGGLGAFVLARRWVAAQGRLAPRPTRTPPPAKRSRDRHADPFETVELQEGEEEPFDIVREASEESFPASDPPAFIGGGGARSRPRESRPSERIDREAHPIDPRRNGPEDEWSPK